VLPATGGLHRWVWDLRYAPPYSITHGYPISAVPHATPREPQGPLALPGDYRVRLTVEGHALEEPLRLRPDPRVTATPGALAEQLHLATDLATLLTDSSRALSAARSEQAQLQALKPTGAAAQAVSEFQGQLSSLLESKDKEDGAQKAAKKPLLPDVQEHISGLYAELLRGDAAPTSAQLAAAATAREQLTGLLTDWRQLQSQVTDLNRRLKSAGLAVLRPELAPARDANLADEP